MLCVEYAIRRPTSTREVQAFANESVGQLVIQLIGVGSVGIYTALLTFVLLKAIDVVVGLRVSEEEEIEGLDINQHNERGYDM